MSENTKVSGVPVFSTEVLWQKAKDLLRVEHLLTKEELDVKYVELFRFYKEEEKRVNDYIITLSFPKKYDSDAFKFSILAKVLCKRYESSNFGRDVREVDDEVTVMRREWLDNQLIFVKKIADGDLPVSGLSGSDQLKNVIQMASDLVSLIPAGDGDRKDRAFDLWQKLEAKAKVVA